MYRLITIIVLSAASWKLGLSLFEGLSLILFVLYLIYFVRQVGRRIVIFELTVLMALLTWLVMPILFYHVFTESNELAWIWDKYMRVPSDEYYSFVLPATLLMAVGIHLPLANRHVLYQPEIYFRRIREFLNKKVIVGVLLIVIGLLSTFVSPYVPVSLGFVFYLLEHLSFVGLLYLYFSEIPFRSMILTSGLVALLIQSIVSAMFGELIYISFLAASLLLSVYRLKSHIKWIGLVTAVFLIFLLQAVKHEYRDVAWDQGADPVFFFQAVGDKIVHPEKLWEPYTLFTFAIRLNQGWLIANTMYHVPQHYDYGKGKTLLKSAAAILVPRVFWPDKPTSGGEANLKRFWGVELRGYSMNIGPIGEAYANFGKWGGMIFMFLYGVTLNVFLSFILGLVKRYPTLLLWFPIL
ncbi:MAG: hypothetical protein R3275_13720, partial [Saprospiraceae bacterium]|nr:hypothetical protein [Saprospiraceae bacterium]